MALANGLITRSGGHNVYIWQKIDARATPAGNAIAFLISATATTIA
jgi:hypothetical protein